MAIPQKLSLPATFLVGGFAGWSAHLPAGTFTMPAALTALFVNSDTVGATIGAALTIGGTVYLTRRDRRRQEEERFDRERARLLATFDVILDVLGKGMRYDIDNVEIDVALGKEIILGHHSRLTEALGLAMDVRSDVRHEKLLGATHNVQRSLRRGINDLESEFQTTAASWIISGKPLVALAQAVTSVAVEAVLQARKSVQDITS